MLVICVTAVGSDVLHTHPSQACGRWCMSRSGRLRQEGCTGRAHWALGGGGVKVGGTPWVVMGGEETAGGGEAAWGGGDTGGGLGTGEGGGEACKVSPGLLQPRDRVLPADVHDDLSLMQQPCAGAQVQHHAAGGCLRCALPQ